MYRRAIFRFLFIVACSLTATGTAYSLSVSQLPRVVNPAQNPECRLCDPFKVQSGLAAAQRVRFTEPSNRDGKGENRAYVLNPVSANDFNERGNYHLNRADYDAAISDYTMAIELDRLHAFCLLQSRAGTLLQAAI